tara:strand:+ start:153 stop:314 length:162 start_codon:yes stop_codon:yes gene_type:complete
VNREKKIDIKKNNFFLLKYEIKKKVNEKKAIISLFGKLSEPNIKRLSILNIKK